MVVAVIGGNLQGVEITYLAKKAGFEVLLIDRNSDVPACGLCDQFLQVDITDDPNIATHLKECDIVFPAFENIKGLTVLTSLCLQLNKPLVFDLSAYLTSSSKLISNQLFSDLKFSLPVVWPGCGFPLIVKPNEGSGSDGVIILKSMTEAQQHYSGQFPPDDCVIQQYIEGPSYSIEILGVPGNYLPLQITELGMDRVYDCKSVAAPVDLPSGLVKAFESLALKIAESLKLKGIMDVEVVLHENQLKILEIDARFPSQTPIAVFWSSGINMVKVLCDLFLDFDLPEALENDNKRYVVFEHINISLGGIQIKGEHIMSSKGALHIEKNFFGADEAITNYQEGIDKCVATLIMVADTRDEILIKQAQVMENIKNRFGFSQVIDLSPVGINIYDYD